MRTGRKTDQSMVTIYWDPMKWNLPVSSCQDRGSFVSKDKVNGLVETIRKTPVFWSSPARGSRVALPHIHLEPDYPRIPQNQLPSLI